MKNKRPGGVVLVALILALMFLFQCERTPTPSVFQNKPPERPDPVITEILPPGKAIAGISAVTVKGKNFSPDTAENSVFFGATRAKMISASETELVVRAPDIVEDSIPVRVSVRGAWLYSNVVYYSLEEAAIEYGLYGLENEDLYGITVDTEENLYVSLNPFRLDKITPDGVRHDNWGKTTGVLNAKRMKVGPGGYIYLVKHNTRIYRIPLSGGTSSTYISGLPGRVYDFDFDPDGNIYAGGNGDYLMFIDGNKNVSTVADYPDVYIKGVRVLNGYVYVAGTQGDTLAAVWRNKINGPGNLAPRELVFNLTAANIMEGIELLSFAFDADGNMYLGTNAPDPIIVVKADQNYSAFEPLYPGYLLPDVFDMAWGTGTYLYVTRRANSGANSTTRIIRINVQKKSAPYYGRGQ